MQIIDYSEISFFCVINCLKINSNNNSLTNSILKSLGDDKFFLNVKYLHPDQK